jgi:hypothetical protein
MFKPKTFTELCQAMQTRAEVEIDNTVGVINAIEAEDGSGRCWNVTINAVEYSTDYATPVHPISVPKTIFFRE